MSLNKSQLLPAFAVLAAVFICANLFAQPGEFNQKDSNGKKQGRWEVKFQDGSLHYKGQFKDDVPVGTFEYYFEGGRLKARLEYRGNSNVAMAHIFYDNEQSSPMAQGKYVDQKKDSTWVFYFEEGGISARETYQNDQRHGLSETFYEDGSLSEKVIYENGVKNGLWEQYYQNGNLQLKATVVNGLHYEGEYAEYYENGSKLITGRYEDGKKTGSWWHYHKNGAPEIIYLYSNGEIIEEHPQNGEIKQYYFDDILKSEHTYKEGKKNGPFKEYYHKGEWRTETATDQFGNEKQVQRLYGTQVQREGKYLNGKLHGEVTYYLENGKIDKVEVYQNGEKIK